MFTKTHNRLRNLTALVLWGALALLAASALAACSAISETTTPLSPGTYATTIAEADIAEERLKLAEPSLAGLWELELSAGSRYVVIKDGAAVADGHYTIEGDEITFTDELGPLACTGRLDGAYRWSLSGQILALTRLEDRCAHRHFILTAHNWSGAEARSQKAALPAGN